jgi:predicted DNA-binding antitoxin AbrB/MazE fold protein
MPITVEAIYEGGVLRPVRPLPLKEHEKVRITVDAEVGWAERTQGLLRWTGDVDILDRLILDPDLEYQP